MNLIERREQNAAKHAQFCEHVAKNAVPGTLDEIKDAASKSIYQYLRALTPVEFTLRKEACATTTDPDISILQVTVNLPAGTKGWLYKMSELKYDKYTCVGDEWYPAQNANIIKRTTYYQFCCLIDGRLVDSFKTVETEK